MADGNDIIRITDRQTLLGQVVLNVYFYQLQDTGTFGDGYLDDIAAHFVEAVITPVTALQINVLEHTELFLENLTNGLDILTYDTDFPIEGSVSGEDVMPPFVSYGFQLIRESRATRNGYKRFAGVPENMVDSGVYVGSPTLISDVETGLAADIVSGLATLCHPVIVRHPIDVPLISPVFSNVGASLFRGIGSQNTRKFGRGV